jgi:phage-related protein (TIGR01555 family)
MDSAIGSNLEWLNSTMQYSQHRFPGFQVLSELAQVSEYRAMAETTAQEMCRKWICFESHGDGDVSGKIEEIEAAFKFFQVRDKFLLAAKHDGFFGRGVIAVDIKGANDEQLKLPLVVAKQTIKQGSLKALVNVEPIWTSPYTYNAVNPLDSDFYVPTAWWVLGKQMHSTRLLQFVSRPVPDMLKPSYNFSGLSLSQLAEPYVQNWLRTRQSVSDMLHSFSVSGLKTDLSTLLGPNGGNEGMISRARMFNQMRDNRGLMLIDKETEEFFQVNTPLSGLEALQAQAQEQMAAPSHIPLVKLLGITPSGLNASSEGEIKVFYDHIAAMQNDMFLRPLKRVLDIVQLHLFGVIDDSICIRFEPLDSADETEAAVIRKTDAETGQIYIAAGVVSQEEERARLASDPLSGYTSIAVEDIPETPDADETY